MLLSYLPPSLERPAAYHQLQKTIPPPYWKPQSSWWSERFLLYVSEALIPSSYPHKRNTYTPFNPYIPPFSPRRLNCSALWGGCVSALSVSVDQEGSRTWDCVLLQPGVHLCLDPLLRFGAGIPVPQETLQHRIKLLQTCCPDVCGHEIHLETGDIRGPLLDPLQFIYLIRHHLDYPVTYAKILFVYFSWAFNTIITEVLHWKLSQLSACFHLSMNDKLPDWQKVAGEAGKHHIISTWSPPGVCPFPTALLPLHNWLYLRGPLSKTLGYADDVTVFGLIQDSDVWSHTVCPHCFLYIGGLIFEFSWLWCIFQGEVPHFREVS